ncbi:MAG: hypothetical protein ACI9EK_002074 [Psychroserpens sp.]|jgi:hypothetical protein
MKILDKLGIDYAELTLTRNNQNKKLWKDNNGDWRSVEKAAFSIYEADGFIGCCEEGALLKFLLKCASVRVCDWLLESDSQRGIEGIYAIQNEENNIVDKRDLVWACNSQYYGDLLANVKNSNIDKISEVAKVCDYIADGHMKVTDKSLIEVMFSIIGNENLLKIAKTFKSEPYTYRAGWPDLTLMKDGVLEFIEVKAPNDRLQKSQKIIYETIFKKLSLPFKYSVLLIKES